MILVNWQGLRPTWLLDIERKSMENLGAKRAQSMVWRGTKTQNIQRAGSFRLRQIRLHIHPKAHEAFCQSKRVHRLHKSNENIVHDVFGSIDVMQKSSCQR